jgi:hypothetical protein
MSLGIEIHSDLSGNIYNSAEARVITSRSKRWAGNVACMGERRVVYRVLVRIPAGRRPLRRPMCR